MILELEILYASFQVPPGSGELRVKPVLLVSCFSAATLETFQFR